MGPPSRRPGADGRARRARRAGLPAGTGRRAGDRAVIEIRRPPPAGLSAIERIEREAYPTPWSRSMFAGELAKPSSISLGAFQVATDALVGYLITSRYVDAWHIMNLAVAVGSRRRGIAIDLLDELFRLTD